MIRTEDLIGATRSPEKISEEDFADIITKAISKPYEKPEAISRCFCRHCGLYGEVLEEYIWSLIKTTIATQHPLHVSWKNIQELREYYFITDNCEICRQKGERVKTVEMKKI